MNEIWKSIVGNREIYAISNFGNVKTLDREGARGLIVKGHALTQHKNSSGYYRVNMNLYGKQQSFLVHRLVALYFVENKNGYEFVNHIDGNKLNNRSDNLEWCTRSENEVHAWKIGLKNKEKICTKGERHGMHKLTQKDVDYIRSVHKPYDKKYGTKPLAEQFNVTPQEITNIVNYKNWVKTLPYAKELVCNE